MLILNDLADITVNSSIQACYVVDSVPLSDAHTCSSPKYWRSLGRFDYGPIEPENFWCSPALFHGGLGLQKFGM